jgi:hypothetical protein
MKVENILLISAFFPPSIGGPATFVSAIGPEFIKMGYRISYANFEPYKKLSKLKRNLLFVRDVWKLSQKAELVVIADTWSALIPAVFVCILRRKKYAVRIGGDFLWETYLARTKDHKKLSLFYLPLPKLSIKEKIIYTGIRGALRHAEAVIFNTSWQRDIWERPYGLKNTNTCVVENALVTGATPYMWKNGMQKIIRCPVRASEFKNTEMLKTVWQELSQKYPNVVLSFDYINPQERAKVLSETYAIIQPSISDVAPNLICESVASGCPFICTDDTGIRNLFSQDIGLYVDSTNEHSIRENIEMILDENIHGMQAQKISEFKMIRTYKILAEEYHQIWNKI